MSKNLHPDFVEINDALAQDMRSLCENLGLIPNHSRSNKRELRFGRNGSLSIATNGPKQGSWHDFEAGRGGGPLGLIERELGCDWRTARDWAVTYLGWSNKAPPKLKPVKKPKTKTTIPTLDEGQAREHKAQLAAVRYSLYSPISGTLAEAYLAKRGIAGTLPDNLRFAQRTRYGYPALVVPATNSDGEVRAIQMIHLNADATKADIPKITNGALSGSVVSFPGTRRLILAEGVETALSVWKATGFEVWAVLGTSNFTSAPVPSGTSLVIAADDFTPGSQAEAATQKAARSFTARGCEVRVTYLPPDGGDFNDIHQRDGLNAVREIIEAAEEWREPDIPMGVSLAEGKAELERVVAEFVYDATQGLELAKSQPGTGKLPIKPNWIINATTGIGKSSTANQAISKHLAEGGGPVCVFDPTCRLAQQQADDFAEATARPAAVWRGLTQDDPDDPDGGLMCRNKKLSKAAVQAGVEVKRVCKICPSRTECGYVRQQAQRADVWFLAHEMMFYKRPPGVPDPDFIVVDEDFRQAGMKQNFKIVISSLEVSLEADLISSDSRKVLSIGRGKLAKALRACMGGYLTSEALRSAGITVDLADDCNSIEWDRKPESQISEDEEATIRSLHLVRERFNPRIPKLWEMVTSLLRGGHAYAPGIEVDIDNLPDGSPVEVARLTYREAVNGDWLSKPTLFLDATARPEIIKHYCPNAIMKADIRISATYEHVTWIDHAFSKARLTPTATAGDRYNKARRNNLEDVRRWIEVRAAETRPRKMLVICNQSVECLLRQGWLPSNVLMSHFNDNRGVNSWDGVHWSEVGALAIIGRTLPNKETIQRQAEQFVGRPLPEDDEIVQAIRWLICEAELINGAIGRGRGVHRSEGNPLDIYLLNNVWLPVAYDDVTIWDNAQPSIMEVLSARGIMFGDKPSKGYWDAVAAVVPDIVPSPDAARMALSREQTSMNIISIDKCSREVWYSGKLRLPGARYSVPVRYKHGLWRATEKNEELPANAKRAYGLGRESVLVPFVPERFRAGIGYLV